MANNPTSFNANYAGRIKDPYAVDDADEENLLHVGFPAEIAAPLSLTPSGVSRVDDENKDPLGINAIAAPSLGVAEPQAAQAAPAGETVSSYIQDNAAAKPAMFSPHYTTQEFEDAKRRRQEAYGAVQKEGYTNPSRLVSAAPKWYKGGPPPTTSPWAGIVGALGGSIAAGPEQRLKDPNRSPFLKQKDAQKAALASGMSSALVGLFGRGKEQYDANQNAALKEAQMQRTVGGGSSRSSQALRDANEEIKLMQQDELNSSLIGNRNFNQGIEKAKHDPNDPEVKAWKNALVTSGRATPAELDNMTKETIHGMMGALNQRNSAEATATNNEARSINEERKSALEHGYKATEQYGKEAQEQARKVDESQIDGLELNGAPPPKEVANKLRETSAKSHTFLSRLDEMTAIQNKLNELGRGWTGPLNEWLGNPEVKQLQAKAKILQDTIGFSIRNKEYGDFGVPQRWEALKIAAMAPQAGTPSGYLKGVQTWKAIADDVRNMWNDHVHYSGYHFPGEKGFDRAVTGNRPAPEAPKVAPRAVVRGGKVVPAEELPPSEQFASPAAVPTAPAAAPAAGPTGPKKYRVSGGGKTQERELSLEQVQQLKQKYGAQIKLEEI